MSLRLSYLIMYPNHDFLLITIVGTLYNPNIIVAYFGQNFQWSQSPPLVSWPLWSFQTFSLQLLITINTNNKKILNTVTSFTALVVCDKKIELLYLQQSRYHCHLCGNRTLKKKLQKKYQINHNYIRKNKKRKKWVFLHYHLIIDLLVHMDKH